MDDYWLVACPDLRACLGSKSGHRILCCNHSMKPAGGTASRRRNEIGMFHLPLISNAEGATDTKMALFSYDGWVLGMVLGEQVKVPSGC